MSSPDISQTHVNAFDFRMKMQQVKQDGQNNLVAVDKQTGNVTIYSSDQKIPDSIRQGLALNRIVFEDFGDNDAHASIAEVNQFTQEVMRAGTKYDPSDHIRNLKQTLDKAKTHLTEEMGQMNVRRHIEDQLDKLSLALDSQNLDEIKKWSALLQNSAKQLYFSRFYLPDHGFISLPQPEIKLASELTEVAKTAEWIKRHIEQDR